MRLSPDLACCLAVAGVLLVYLEFIRPGKVLPGIGGLILLFTASDRLRHFHPAPAAVAILFTAAALFGLECCWRFPYVGGLAGTVAVAVGLWRLFPKPPRITPALAVSVSLLMGAVTLVLGQTARLARRNKRLDLQ